MRQICDLNVDCNYLDKTCGTCWGLDKFKSFSSGSWNFLKNGCSENQNQSDDKDQAFHISKGPRVWGTRHHP